MKKNLLFLFALLFVSAISFGQSLSVTHGGEELGNTVQTVYGDPFGFELVFHADVTNNSDQALEVLVKQVHLEIPTGAQGLICWGQCFGATTMVSPSPIEIAPGQTILTAKGFSGHYRPFSNEGNAKIRYTMFDKNNVSDSVSFIVEYKANIGIEDHIANANFTIYPNPATDYVNVDYDLANNTEEATVEIFNLVGQSVKTIRLESNAGTATVNTSNLSQGVYFYAIRVGEKILETQKLVIK